MTNIQFIVEPAQREGVLEYLASTHETACFELIDPEDLHVELVDLKKPELRFIGEQSKHLSSFPFLPFPSFLIISLSLSYSRSK